LHAGKKLYVVAGGVFHTTTTIGKGVAVPDSCWKIVLVLNPEQGRSHVTSSTEVYSVMMPNSDAITGTWIDYKKTVDQIEASTGYDFMNLIPVNIQSILESK
jgi:endonuclease G